MMDLAVPLRELVNVVALVQALIFAGILLANRFRHDLSNRILIVTFIIIATVKLDELYQLMGGLESHPSLGFVFTPVQWLLTPTLYFFVLAKVNTELRFRRIDLWHLLPATASLIYLSITYFSLTTAGKITYIESGVLSEPINAYVIPMLSDVIQLGYLLAARRKLVVHGATLRDWFSHVNDSDLLWARRVLAIWVFAFVGHMLLTLSVRVFEWYAFARIVLDLMNIAHLLLISALMMLAVASHFQTLSPVAAAVRKKKYASSDQTVEERRTLYARLRKSMEENAHHLQMDLDLGELAALLSVTSRDLSEAINGEGDLSFYDFVSQYRVNDARRLLLEEPDEQILAIAHRSGFNSKSTFNKVFKDTTGVTPSQFRAVNSRT